MKNFIKKFVIVFILMNLALTIQMAVASADNGTVPPPKPGAVLTPLQLLQAVGEKTCLPSYIVGGSSACGTSTSGQHPDAIPDVLAPGGAIVISPIYFAIDMFRYVVSTIAFIVVVIAAIKLVSYSSEEEATKAKNTLLVGILGLIIIQLADPIVKKMFFGEQGEAFEDLATAEFFAEETVSQVRGIIGFIQYFLGAVAVLTIVIRGFALISTGGDEEAMTRAKKHIMYGLAGLAIVGLSEIVVRGVIFPEAGAKLPDVATGRLIIVKVTNFLASFISILAFAALFYAGYRYVTAGGNEEVSEKVKKTMLGAVIALGLALAAFAIVNTFVTLDQTVGPAATAIPE